MIPIADSRDASRLLTLLGTVVVIAGLHFGRTVLIPLALATVLAFLLSPVVDLLEKCHLGRVTSVLVVLALSFAMLAGVGWGMTTQLMEILSHLSDYKTNIHHKIEAVRAPGNSGLGKATQTVNDLSKELSSASDTAANRNLVKDKTAPIPVQVATPPRNAAEYLRDAVGPLTGILETSGIVVIFTLFILVKREDLRNRMLRLAGSGQLNVMTQALDDASHRLGRYLLLQFLVNAAYGVLFGFGIYLIGVPHSLLWGALGTLLRFVPYIGTPVAALFPMGMAMAVFPGWSQVGLVFALFLILEVTIANFIEPWLYGSHIGVSSLAILVAAIFWGMLWGPVGLVLSTPLTVCLILLGRYIPQLNFLEIMLGDEPVLSPQMHFYSRLLALDDEEAHSIANRYLKDNAIGTLYDSVLIPALGLAEQDRHRNILDETRTRFVHQSMRELIEELNETPRDAAGPEDSDASASPATTARSGPKILCVPARDEADEIVAAMVVQLLWRAGCNAESVPITAVSTMLERIGQARPGIVCISALPPFAAGQAKSLCRRIRQQYPAVKIVLGLWEFPGGVAKAQERIGTGCVDLIGTSLAQVVPLMSAEGRIVASPSNAA